MEDAESQVAGEAEGDARIHLFLIADQALFRASLGRLLSSVPDFDVVGERAMSKESLDLLNGSGADVALLEFEPDIGNAREFLAAAIRSGYPGRFLAITTLVDARASARALQLGAAGIFLKSDSADRLLQAIRRVANGEMWIDPRVIRVLADRYLSGQDDVDGLGFTERERTVLTGILGGLSNRKIGEDLKLSESSVKAVVQQLFEKTGVRTRSQLVRIAMTHSLYPGIAPEATREKRGTAQSYP